MIINITNLMSYSFVVITLFHYRLHIFMNISPTEGARVSVYHEGGYAASLSTDAQLFGGERLVAPAMYCTLVSVCLILLTNKLPHITS
jgi:hypothetical protein